MPSRLHVPGPLAPDLDLELPAGAARHVQVLRLQPGAAVTLFDGLGGQWSAVVTQMGRHNVAVRVALHEPVECELPFPVTLALAMPANDRMDLLVEKAVELGVMSIQPLVCERSVLRLAGERALRRQAHWQAVAVAACEQCGRNRVPQVAPPLSLTHWLAALEPGETPAQTVRWLLSLADAEPWPARLAAARGLLAQGAGITLLSGPEGGFTAAEESAARSLGFAPTRLVAPVLRADTAPLAALAALALQTDPA